MGKRKLLSKTKAQNSESTQTTQNMKNNAENLELAGDFTLEYQKKNIWQNVRTNISKLISWYFVRNKPPMPNTLLTRMFEYKCTVKDNMKKELSSKKGLNTSKYFSNKSTSRKEVQQHSEEISTDIKDIQSESVSKSESKRISEKTQSETTSSTTSTSYSSLSTCYKLNDKHLLAQRKLELLTGRMVLPWATDSNSFIGCEKCTCSKAKEKPKDLPFDVDMANINNDLLPNQAVKLSNEEVCFIWSFEDSDEEKEYMTPKMFEKDNKSLSDKAELIKRTVDLLNGRAKFSWMDENSNFDEEKWKNNAKKFNNYLEELYI